MGSWITTAGWEKRSAASASTPQSPRSRLRRRQPQHGADRCHDPRHFQTSEPRELRTATQPVTRKGELCHQGSPFLSHALRQSSATTLPTYLRGHPPRRRQSSHHLPMDERGHLPQANQTDESKNISGERFRQRINNM